MIKPEDAQVILKLSRIPGRPNPQITPERLLAHFHATDGKKLGMSLLSQAAQERNADDVELALMAASPFGIGPEYLDLLIELSGADWHFRHEDIASTLGEIGSTRAVEALTHLASWVPDYLDFDESRALATKAIYSLARIPGQAASAALEKISQSADPDVADCARERLRERRSG